MAVDKQEKYHYKFDIELVKSINPPFIDKYNGYVSLESKDTLCKSATVSAFTLKRLKRKMEVVVKNIEKKYEKEQKYGRIGFGESDSAFGLMQKVIIVREK